MRQKLKIYPSKSVPKSKNNVVNTLSFCNKGTWYLHLF